MKAGDLKVLKDLSRRATEGHIIEYGSANVVIYASEFHALEEATRILSKKD